MYSLPSYTSSRSYPSHNNTRPRRHRRNYTRLLNLKRSRYMLADAAWPLPDLDGSPAVVIGEERDIARVHVGYADASGAPFTPPHTPVRCAKAGIITGVYETAEGICIEVDHRNGFSTCYMGLVESPFRATNWCAHLVTRGQLLGCVGGPPGEPPRPLMFQVLRFFEEPFPMAIDAKYFLAQWPHIAMEIGTDRSAA
jgi:hypothetical protein